MIRTTLQFNISPLLQNRLPYSIFLFLPSPIPIHVCFGEQQQHQYFTPLRSPPSTCPHCWILLSPAQVRCFISDGQWQQQPLFLLRSRLSQVVSRISFSFLQIHQFLVSLFEMCYNCLLVVKELVFHFN